jgi:hypothetical protein
MEEQAAVHNQTVEIRLRINSYVFLFGIPAMFTAIILGSLLSRELFVRAPAVNVAAPQVNAHLTVPPSTVQNTIQVPESPVTVNVPAQSSPHVTVSPQDTPQISFTLPEGKPGEVRVVEKIVEKRVEVQVPVYVELKTPGAVTLDDVCVCAERYLAKNPQHKIESERWLKLWQSRVQERQGDEQALFSATLIDKRNGFKPEATSAEITEICRLLLRMRDAKLALPSVFREHVTAQALVSLKNFLEK